MENSAYKSYTTVKEFDEPVICPHCAAENYPKLTVRIDARDTKTVKKLLDRTLFEFKCKKCKQKYIIDNCFEFVDEENSVDLHCTMDPKHINEFVVALSENRTTVYDQKFRFTRVVATFEEFREKHAILTNGLDDRILELIKLDIRENRAAECGTVQKVLCISVNERSIGIRVAGEKKAKVFYITYDEYAEFKERYAHWLNNYKPVIIDASWAIDHAD